MGREDGGVVLRILLWVVLLAIVAGGVLFVYVRVQEPLVVDPATVRAVGVGEDPARPVLKARARIFVATNLRNEGRMPVTVRGLATQEGAGALFVATAISLGDGRTASPSGAASFTPITIDPGEGVGILLTYEVNPDLDCGLFSKDEGDPWAIRRVTVEASAYAMPFTQTIAAPVPFALIEGPTRERCAAALEGAEA